MAASSGLTMNADGAHGLTPKQVLRLRCVLELTDDMDSACCEFAAVSTDEEIDRMGRDALDDLLQLSRTISGQDGDVIAALLIFHLRSAGGKRLAEALDGLC